MLLPITSINPQTGLQIFSLTLPLLISGLSLILVLRYDVFKVLDQPIDLGVTVNQRRLFGDSKTYRGILVHIGVAISVSVVLYVLAFNGFSQVIHPIFQDPPILIGLLFAIFYSIGELINSAIKRQLDLSPGAVLDSPIGGIVQRFFDLSDGIILVAIGLVAFTSVTLFQAAVAAATGILLHYSTDLVMRSLRLK